MPKRGARDSTHQGHRGRLRERFLKGGADALADYELLELALFYTKPQGDMKPVAKALLKIGVDDVPGYFTPDVLDMGMKTSAVTSVTPRQAAEQGLTILDVRGINEYNEAHIPDAYHIAMGDIPQRMGDLPMDQPFVLQCGMGVRSQLVWSLLERAGFTNMLNLAGGLDAWRPGRLGGGGAWHR